MAVYASGGVEEATFAGGWHAGGGLLPLKGGHRFSTLRAGRVGGLLCSDCGFSTRSWGGCWSGRTGKGGLCCLGWLRNGLGGSLWSFVVGEVVV